MPCDHKFRSYLHLERINFEPVTLIVGTFNPAWPADNTAEWFYGRTADNYFWDILPRLYGEPSLINATPTAWKQFCHDKQIALTDLISSIDDADSNNPEHNRMLGGFSDKAIEYNFDDLVYVNIVQLLKQHPTIKHVYLTRGITEAFWRHLWHPAMHYCNHHHIHERRLLTPSNNARFQHEMYNKEHPDPQIPLLEDYLLMRWKQDWHL
jgi:hypothetical protein